MIHIILYISIILSLVWGRFRFFKVNSGTTQLNLIFYDLAVAVQILFTVYYMTRSSDLVPLLVYLSFLLYLSGLLIFWWSIFTAKSLDFAFSDRVGSIVTSGPFRLVRHPFYISYILVWLSSSLLFNSPALWISLFYLIAFYILSARKEEKVILGSVYSEEYKNYVQDVGMFLPRINKWKLSNSEP